MTKTMDVVEQVLDEESGGGCRDWPYATGAKGYAEMGLLGVTVRVGHLILTLTGRPRPSREHHQLHSCDRPVCIAPWHLRWGTNEENRAEMVARGRQSKGEHRPTAKLTDEAVLAIRASDEPLAVLAERYGVGQPTLWKARVGETWRHLPMGETA